MRAALTWLASTVACGALVSGCKDDPPPPPLPTASASAASAKDRPVDASVREAPAFSDQTNKRMRVELCYYGSLGLKVTRDAYLASLKGKEPGPGRLPSFGDFPENAEAGATPSASATPAESAAPSASPSGSGRAMPRPGASGAPVAPPAALDPSVLATRLPFTRYLSACALADRPEEKRAGDELIDKALAEYQPWAMALNREIVAAQRYYGTKQFEQDKFERSKASHKELSKSFDELDAKLAALGKAFDAWEAQLGEAPERLDEAARLGVDSLDKARTAARVAFADKIDAQALENATKALVLARAALEAAGNSDGKAPHPREMVPRLNKLLDVLAEAQRGLKNDKLGTLAVYGIAYRVADLVEANHRALGMWLRMNGQTRAAGPLTTLRPRLDTVNGRPDLKVRAVQNPPPAPPPPPPEEE